MIDRERLRLGLWQALATGLALVLLGMLYFGHRAEMRADEADNRRAAAESQLALVEAECQGTRLVADRCDRALLTCQAWQVRVLTVMEYVESVLEGR